LATEAAAISPLAPARFSTTTARAQPFADAGRDQARQKIVGAARREADDEAQWLVGKIDRLGAGFPEWQTRKSGEERASTKHGHRRLC